MEKANIFLQLEKDIQMHFKNHNLLKTSTKWMWSHMQMPFICKYMFLYIFSISYLKLAYTHRSYMLNIYYTQFFNMAFL